MAETIDHLLLGCNYFGSIWHIIRHWLGINAVDPFWLTDHLFQLGQIGGTSKRLCSFIIFNLVFVCLGDFEKK